MKKKYKSLDPFLRFQSFNSSPTDSHQWVFLFISVTRPKEKRRWAHAPGFAPNRRQTLMLWHLFLVLSGKWAFTVVPCDYSHSTHSSLVIQSEYQRRIKNTANQCKGYCSEQFEYLKCKNSLKEHSHGNLDVLDYVFCKVVRKTFWN